MKVSLRLGYKPHHSECVSVECHSGVSEVLERCDQENMSCHFTHPATGALEYNYTVRHGESLVRQEWGGAHSIPLAVSTEGAGASEVSETIEELLVCDMWQAISADVPLCSSLFTESIFRRSSPTWVSLKAGGLMVEVRVPVVSPAQHVVMVGSSIALGAWDVSRGVVMADGSHPRWRTPSLEMSEELLGSEFKFVIVESATGQVVAWERGDNRNFERCRNSSCQAIYIVESEPIFELPAWRGAGVAIPLFSLRSESSWGVGEFADMKLLVDWAVSTGQKIIQILPINDTTMNGSWEDSYPYNANSSFALHPQYLSLRGVGELEDRALQADFEQQARALNALSELDYVAVNALKNSFLRLIYAQVGQATLASKEYQKFFCENRYWLESFALFSLLRDRHSTPHFEQWGDEALYSEALMERYRKSASDELGYYYFVQYHLHCQLLEARAYALSRGVAFKGDIPIGVSRTSVDVWVSPRLFRLDSQAGAPPDDFSIMGQNWGFPTYNWGEMSLDGYAWWKARFSKMAEYFDAYRIDHILGFFRIWEIPLSAIHGLLGYFSPALPYTPQQMWEGYGFSFERSLSEPSINMWLLQHLFGQDASQVAQRFLIEDSADSYRFKSEFDSQAKVASQVEEPALREGLLQLFTELLFVEDPRKHGHYHPRIAAHNTFKYRALSEHDKQRYDALYNDFFYRRHNDFWRSEALHKLPTLLSATRMLTCGEDLGMIPECVPQVMEQQQILSLEIERMPKDPALQFGNPAAYPYRSVCTTSTHDMNPLRAWLLEDKPLTASYLSEHLGVSAEVGEDCPGWICQRVLQQHLASPAMWTILPLQDWMSLSDEHRNPDPQSERINVPSSSRHYWRYRMHCTLEQLLAMDELSGAISDLIMDAQR